MLSGSHGVRLSITLALHLCSDISDHSGYDDLAQTVRPEESYAATPLLLAYPLEVVHFLAFGCFTSKAPSGAASKACSGGKSNAGGKSALSPGGPPLIDPAVLLPSRVVFCAFLDLLVQRQIEGRGGALPPAGAADLAARRHSSGRGPVHSLSSADLVDRQSFIDAVALRLLDIVAGDPGGPYAKMSTREAGQSSPDNACKAQAWQALCLLCRGLPTGGGGRVAVVAAERAWTCLLQSVHHANIRPFVQMFLSRLFGLSPQSGVASLLIPALLDYGQEKYQVLHLRLYVNMSAPREPEILPKYDVFLLILPCSVKTFLGLSIHCPCGSQPPHLRVSAWPRAQ